MQFPSRDENTRAIVQAETGEDASIVLDPTLVYDFGDDEVMTRRIREFGDYLLIYAYVSDPEMVKNIQDLAAEKGLKRSLLDIDNFGVIKRSWMLGHWNG